MTPEVFVIPKPLRMSELSLPCALDNGLTVMVKALAPGSKIIPSTIVFDETKTSVVLEKAKVAISATPFGTVVGVQLVDVFQSPETGLISQGALPAWLTWMQSIKIKALKIPVTRRSCISMKPRLKSKAITLQGAGIGSTIIQDGVQAGPLLTIQARTGDNTKLVRVTGIEFQNGGRARPLRGDAGVIRWVGTDNRTDARVRWDHCKYWKLNGPVY